MAPLASQAQLFAASEPPAHATLQAYSYMGMEGLAMAAAEVENPRRALAKAVRRVFYRILMFYILGILVVGAAFPASP